jgi:iron(III) transport system substrate-binding protein
MNRRSASRFGAAGMAVGLLLVACTAPGAPGTPGDAATGTPAASGTLSVYSALNEATNNAFIEAFQEEQPNIEVELLPLAAAGELQTRIRSEANAPRADVFIGGSSEFHAPLANDGLLAAYESPNAENIDAAFRDPENRWTGWYIGIFGIVVNTDRWQEEMGDTPMPATWDDLLASELEGQIVMPDPVTTGGGYIFLATQVFRFDRDEEQALEFMEQLHANIAQYTETSPQTIELVSQGQFLVGLNWGHDILTAAEQGAPVEFIAPPDTANEIGAVSIVEGGPNPEAARPFVDWVLTEEAGRLNVELSNRISVLPEVEPAPGAPTLEEAQLVDYDREWATENKDRLIGDWQAAIGR